jgi:type II secretory pathway pseudopilin PulG
MRTGSTPTQCRGFTYLGVLLLMAIIGASLASTGVVWHTVQQREREASLLYIGDQMRAAIGAYYRHAGHQYPQQLSDLLRDPRDVGTTRYLRKIYFDPVTGTQEWGLVKTAQDRIIGVYSLSDQHPIKQANFSQQDRSFENQEKYSDWKFIYVPTRVRTHRRVLPVSPTNGTQNNTGQ